MVPYANTLANQCGCIHKKDLDYCTQSVLFFLSCMVAKQK